MDFLKSKSAKSVYKKILKDHQQSLQLTNPNHENSFQKQFSTDLTNGYINKDINLLNGEKKPDVDKEIANFIPYLPIDDIRLLKDSRLLGYKTFEWVIYPIQVETFFKEIWEKKPLLIKRHNNEYYENLFSTKKFDEILRKEFINFSENVDVTTYKDGIKEIHNPIGRAYAPVVWDYYKEGCSVRFLNPQTYDRCVWRLSSQLQEFFSSFVGANIYLTPPDSQGFAPHYDDIDAFVLQLEGKKVWKVYPTDVLIAQNFPKGVACVMPLHSSPNFVEERDFKDGAQTKPLLETELEPGDLLYMPRGFVHQASTRFNNLNKLQAPLTKKRKLVEAHSLHMTLSTCQNNTWAKLMEKAFSLALHSITTSNEEMRKSLPPGYLQYMGLPYRQMDANLQAGSLKDLDFYAMAKSGNYTDQSKASLSRLAFVSHFKKLCEACFETISPDMAVDDLSKELYMREALPPCLSGKERQLTILASEPNFGPLAPTQEKYNRERESLIEMTPKTRVKILRHGCFRVICTPGDAFDPQDCEDKIVIYHCLENGRIYEERLPQYFHLAPDVLPCVEHLINAYPKYVSVSSLPMKSDAEKVDVITSLFEKGIIMVSPKTIKQKDDF